MKRKANESEVKRESPEAPKRGRPRGSGASGSGAQQPAKQAKQTKQAKIKTEVKTERSSVPTTDVGDPTQYYPPEMTDKRAYEYVDSKRARPIEQLHDALNETRKQREDIGAGRSVVFWFRTDLRVGDNRGLTAAADAATEAGVGVAALFLVTPDDWAAHGMSPARLDFLFRTLAELRSDLAAAGIPLAVRSADRGKSGKAVLDFCKDVGSSHVWANAEYEVDELRRDAKLVKTGLAAGVAVDVVADTCVVEPGSLATKTGKQYSQFTPWYKSWMAFVTAHPGTVQPSPRPKLARPKHLAKLFEETVPEPPTGPLPLAPLSADRAAQLAERWPAGEKAAAAHLAVFLRSRVRAYADDRDAPAADGTATLSPYLAVGALAARSAVAVARKAGSGAGPTTWIKEVAWRDFYRHVMAHWPHVCMHKPFKVEYSGLAWQPPTLLGAWQAGKTGFPLVDAAMRELAATGYMHNRCRMVVASFLAKDMLVDWRLGERWFMANLIDGDFSSNNGGWQFCSSTGTDSQPYFRIFNPTLQSERFDRAGEYIRRWVPELADVPAPAIHEPFARLPADAARALAAAGYPRPVLAHSECRERALAAFRDALEG
ncbi:DNA photolyase, FAD-binding/Cryptochrome [Dipodascopsis tothii]|uniref:DNA photolyase, FAD-binding/Cryptochrome n=1 Tax=Dipodascopsis tothii TaxID=44089 RepID=UPI0034CE420B